MNKIKGIMNLPAKVAIKKTAVDIEETDKAAERIHVSASLNNPPASPNARKAAAEEKPAVTYEKVRKKMAEPRPRKPSPAPSALPAEKAKSPQPADIRDEPTTRITLDLPASIYKAAKIKSFTEMMTLRSYIIDLLRADLKV